MNPRPLIQRLSALLLVLVFLAGSMVHLWHHCCEGWHPSTDATVSSLCHTTDPITEPDLTEACCTGHHEATQPENDCQIACMALLPGERAVIHHHHHQCCEHNLSPVIDDVVTKNTVKQLTISLVQLPFICLILPKAFQPTFTNSPPSTLLRTGRQLLASHCVLRR